MTDGKTRATSTKSSRPRWLPSWGATVVWAATVIYVLALSAESIFLHQRYATGFDTAIFDQALWLLADGNEPFSTVVGRPMLAGLQPGLALLTPLYWLGLEVPGLLIVQTIGLALAAPTLYWLARDRGAAPSLAAVPALLWLASPWTSSVNLFEFHPQVFAPALLALSVIAGLRRHWVGLGVTAAAAMSLKQDIPMIYFMLGLVLAIHGSRKPGALLSIGAAAWLVVARVAFESGDNSYAFYERRFAGDRGETVSQAFSWMLEHPIEAVTDTLGQSGGVVFLLVLATAALALLAPLWLLLAVPSLAYNVFSAYPPQHSLAFQYHLMTAACLFIAAAIGVGRLRSLTRVGRYALAVMAGAAVTAAVLGGVQVHVRSDRQPFDARDRARFREALALIPDGAPVAAATHLQPHLSHRAELYTLPEPFVPIDWGSAFTPSDLRAKARRLRYVAFVAGGGPVEYGHDITTVLPEIRRLGFREIYRDGRVRVFERQVARTSAP